MQSETLGAVPKTQNIKNTDGEQFAIDKPMSIICKVLRNRG